MAKVVIHTAEAPKSLAGYSQAIKSNGLVFVSGQGPFDPDSGNVVGTTIQEQAGPVPPEYPGDTSGRPVARSITR